MTNWTADSSFPRIPTAYELTINYQYMYGWAMYCRTQRMVTKRRYLSGG